uniref:Reverse transcriptase domain-containing protein n=1 Tax=Myripristis murdjan TaxID=586833 RepID=A0A667ZNP8_9TELE
ISTLRSPTQKQQSTVPQQHSTWCRSQDELNKLEKGHMREPDNYTLRDSLLLCRAQLQEIMHEETAFALFKLKRKYFESGDKAGKMLAMRLKQTESKHLISKIYDCNGQPTQDQKQMNHCFKNYYKKLYESESNPNLNAVHNFFSSICLPSITEVDKIELEEYITDLEIKAAIKHLSNGKTPGEDGFSIEFYKTFQDEIIPFLVMLYNDAIMSQSMPTTMRTAVITTIPKQGKDPTQMSNYRPLSLLNNDYKIFAKILALRLEKVVPSLVHFDQVGFVKGRHASSNMRKLFHVIHRAASLQHPAILLSLDAEKAFDRVEWPYLFYTLQRYGFGPVCMQWIRALYYKPLARVKTNGIMSEPFELTRSTRQGCPVSPIIFVLALEPLACSIRANQQISGIKMYDYDFKINLFADDILLTLSNPEISVKHLFKLINEFGNLSGYKVNWNKSEATPLNCMTFPVHLDATQIVWKKEGLKYLGINIISPIEKIFEINGPKLIKTIKEDLARWGTLPLSLWGRAEIIKMNVFPRLSFMTASIPLKFPESWFKEIKKLFIMFLWGDKKPRISLSKLVRHRNKGGLGIPDIYTYYLAFNGKYPLLWAYYEHHEAGSWIWLENKMIDESPKQTSLSALWYCTKLNTNLKNPIINFSCDIVKVIHKKCAINGLQLPSCPLWRNPLLTAGGKTLLNNKWNTNYNLNKSCFLQYLQLKSILQKFISQGTTMASNKDLDDKFREIVTNSGTVSKLYKLITLFSCSNMDKVKQQWEHDLGKHLPPEQWNSIIGHTNYLSKCVRYKLIQMKILHRTYITPYKTNKMNPQTSDLCWHGCGKRGSLIHMLWHCPEIRKFWEGVQNTLCSIINDDVLMCPEVCLLGAKMDGVKSEEIQQLLTLAYLSVKRIILMNWKVRKPNCFCLNNWLKDFIELIMMERAASALQELVWCRPALYEKCPEMLDDSALH